eukprot:8644351-Karenia_brevis.AAC.1
MLNATARLGWSMVGSTAVRTEAGQEWDLTLDSPAFVKDVVKESFERWRWRRLEARHMALA